MSDKKTAEEINIPTEQPRESGISADEEKSPRENPSRRRRKLPVWAVILGICVLLNILARLSTPFSDIYTDNIFHIISTPLMAVMSLLPFSFGELLIFLGAAAVLTGLPAALISAAAVKKHRKKILKVTALFFAWVLVYIAVTETLNCFIQYHNTLAADKYFPDAGDGYTTAELTQMCEYIITRADELAEKQTRDAEGNIILPDDLRTPCAAAISRITDRYTLMKGFVPRPKKIFFSRFMSQMDLQGIYFPFTMETNYNADMCPSRVPCTVCHETAHTKGYIREDEATFISVCACIESEDDLFMYSGYLTAMNYSVNSVWKYLSDDEKIRLSSMISDTVRADNKFLPDKYREELESKTVFKNETVSKVSDKAMNTSLVINGVQDGKKSYSRMVDLLLMYYYEDEKTKG